MEPVNCACCYKDIELWIVTIPDSIQSVFTTCDYTGQYAVCIHKL
jgi:hypothetical protein